MPRRAIRARTARTMAAAAARKGTTRPGSKTHRRRERSAAARGRLPAPGTAAARRRRNSFLPATDEVRWLKNAALAETLSKEGPGPYSRELDELAEASYRAAYKANQAERRAARPAKPKAKPSKVRVRAHWRRVARR